ncbi:MAG: hypothetical protein AMXMBFR25_23950 [Lysobacterales bacterium]|nr:hypothetical protein [Xanthomonadales bacterium]
MFDVPSPVPQVREVDTPQAGRTGLRHFLDAAISRARNHSSMLAVLCLEIDRRVAAGASADEIDQRLRRCARRSDFVAQTEPQAWMIVAEFMDGPYAAHRLAHRILDSLEQPDADGHACARDSTSIGIATASGHELEAEHLLQRATEALRRARDGSRRLVDAGTPI